LRKLHIEEDSSSQIYINYPLDLKRNEKERFLSRIKKKEISFQFEDFVVVELIKQKGFEF